MYLERKIEHLNNQLSAKTNREKSYKSELTEIREKLQKVDSCSAGCLVVAKGYILVCF